MSLLILYQKAPAVFSQLWERTICLKYIQSCSMFASSFQRTLRIEVCRRVRADSWRNIWSSPPVLQRPLLSGGHIEYTQPRLYISMQDQGVGSDWESAFSHIHCCLTRCCCDNMVKRGNTHCGGFWTCGWSKQTIFRFGRLSWHFIDQWFLINHLSKRKIIIILMIIAALCFQVNLHMYIQTIEIMCWGHTDHLTGHCPWVKHAGAAFSFYAPQIWKSIIEPEDCPNPEIL